MKKALTIAGSDSGGGAGIQADLKTFIAHGVYGASVLTAITAQNTVGVRAVQLLEPALVVAQIEAVLDDIGADAIKTGMLGSAEIIRAVAAKLKQYGVTRLVVDPVMVAKSGDRLLHEDAITALHQDLLPLALVITPNLPEASVLLDRPVEHEHHLRQAAHVLHALGPRYVLLKGGHLRGDPVDLLYDGERFHEFRERRIQTRHTHGTGCTYAAAITALLARDASVVNAVGQAKAYLTQAIARASAIGAGHSPVNHLVQGLPAMPDA